MTSKRAMFLLKCTRNTLDKMAQAGRIRRTKGPSGRTEWNDQDVLQAAGFDPEVQLNVLYARVDPGRITTESAEVRLENQKERLLRYCQKEGIRVDLILGDARKVNRLLDRKGQPAAGLNTLMGLLAEKRVGKLIIDTCDRLVVGASWAMFELLVSSICGCEVVVLNRQLVTTESREESKSWLQDMLAMHKVLTGEVKDLAMEREFVGGFDQKMTLHQVQTYEKKERIRRRNERDGTAKVGKGYSKHLDLSDVFDGEEEGRAYQSQARLPYVLQTP